jgi:hypothetical protein
MRKETRHAEALIIDRERLARALHRATCDCAPGARSVTECVLGLDAGWLEESDRLLGLLREDANARENAPALVRLGRRGLATVAASLS